MVDHHRARRHGESAARRAAGGLLARLACAASALALAACGGAEPVGDDEPVSAYRAEAGFGEVPEGVAFGKPLGVAIDGRGRVLVTHTADRGAGNAEPIERPTIFAFDAETGALLATLGAGLFRYPHGISVDRDDALWVTDSEANRVVKLSPAGEVLLVLGRD
jgi:peptidylamidoglycolate lyase